MRKQWRWCHLTLYAEYAPYKLMRLTADQPAVILYIHVSGLYTIGELHNWSRPSIIRRPHIHVGGRRPKVLPRFFFCLLFMIFYLFSRPPATLEVRWTELSLNRPHAGKYKCDLKNVRNLGPKTTFFSTISQLLNCNGLYLPNETRYTKSGKCVGNYRRSPTSAQNVMNFGPPTA